MLGFESCQPGPFARPVNYICGVASAVKSPLICLKRGVCPKLSPGLCRGRLPPLGSGEEGIIYQSRLVTAREACDVSLEIVCAFNVRETGWISVFGSPKLARQLFSSSILISTYQIGTR